MPPRTDSSHRPGSAQSYAHIYADHHAGFVSQSVDDDEDDDAVSYQNTDLRSALPASRLSSDGGLRALARLGERQWAATSNTRSMFAPSTISSIFNAPSVFDAPAPRSVFDDDEYEQSVDDESVLVSTKQGEQIDDDNNQPQLARSDPCIAGTRVKTEPQSRARVTNFGQFAPKGDEDFFWSNAITTDTGKVRVERRHRQIHTKADERERKEKELATKVSEATTRKKKTKATHNEFDLSLLGRKVPPQPSNPRKVPQLARLGFTQNLEKEITASQRPRSIDIEEADPTPSTSQSHLPAPAWKNALEDELKTASSPVRHDDAGTKKWKQRGELENRLQMALGSKSSQATFARVVAQKLFSATQLTPDHRIDENGNTLSVTVKVIVHGQHFGMLFVIALLCSPYRTSNDVHTNTDTNMATLPMLVSLATRLNVPVSSLAIIQFSTGQIAANRAPTVTDQSPYYRICYPWLDIGPSMKLAHPVILDVFDCAGVSVECGSEEEGLERDRLTRIDGSAESSLNDDVTHTQHHHQQHLREKELEARRAVFGDLDDHAIEELFTGAEEHEMKALEERLAEMPMLAPASLPQSEATIRPSVPFSAYRRPRFATLTYYSSLELTCIAGVIQKTSLRGNSLSLSQSMPRQSLLVSQSASILIDDGGMMIEIEIPTTVVKHWRNVLLNGQGCLIWIGGLHVSERSVTDAYERRGLASLLQSYGYQQSKPLLVLQANESSRFRMQQFDASSKVPQTVKLRSQQFTPLADAVNVKQSKRVCVSAVIQHAVFIGDDDASVWVTDASLMPRTSGSKPPLNTASVMLTIRSYCHLQLLRSFFHCNDKSANSIVLKDLLVDVTCDSEDGSDTSSAGPHFTADDYTDVFLGHGDIRCDLPGFESTADYASLQASLPASERRDPFAPSVNAPPLCLPAVPVPSTTRVTLSLLPLAPLLTKHALHGMSAAPLLIQLALFTLDGVVLRVLSELERRSVCGQCGHDTAMVELKDTRPMVRQAVVGFCHRCQAVNTIKPAARVTVLLQNTDITEPLQVRLSSHTVSSLLPAAIIAGTVDSQPCSPSIAELETELKAQRVSIVGRARTDTSISNATVKLSALRIEGLAPWIDRRILTAPAAARH